MAQTKDVTITVTQEQIDSVAKQITEQLIEHRAEELLTARGDTKAVIMAEIAHRAVLVARYHEYCDTFHSMWAEIFGVDAPFPRDHTGTACDGFKLSDDGETETNEGCRPRPARKLAGDTWGYAYPTEYDERGDRKLCTVRRTLVGDDELNNA